MYRIMELNPQLREFAGDIDLRMFLYRATKSRILTEGQTLNDFANAHNYYGFHRTQTGWALQTCTSFAVASAPTSCTWRATLTTGTRQVIPSVLWAMATGSCCWRGRMPFGKAAG